MGYKIEMPPNAKPDSGPGPRVGDRFGRDRMRSILRAIHLSDVIKPPNSSELMDIAPSTSEQPETHSEIPDHLESLETSFEARNKDTASAMEETNEDGVKASPLNGSQAGDEVCDSPTRNCGHGVTESDRRESNEQLHEELLAHIKRIRAKSTTLLYDVRLMRYDLRIHRFEQ